MFPFNQIEKNGKIIREFKKNVSSSELVWHRDRFDRKIKILEGRGWQLQMDGSLPEMLQKSKSYYIPANTYHRVIKGNTDLVLEIKENPEMKITRRQLRKIIREAAGKTKKYDDNKALTPKQGKNLPDGVQKGIIKKAGGNLDEIEDMVATPTYSGDMHRCMDGNMVPDGSFDCYDDILNRIEDAQYNRNHHTCGTENRVYYNGMLKGLRNKRNRLQKKLEL